MILISAVLATFFGNALRWYTRFQSYPPFARVGDTTSGSLHAEYERQLPVAIYLLARAT